MITVRPPSLSVPDTRLRAGDEERAVVDCPPDSLAAPPDTILRFLPTERLLHWAIAVPFLGCLFSAGVLVLVYNPVLVAYNPDPSRTYRYLFAWMHRGCAVGLILCPSLVLLGSIRRFHIYFYNVRQACVWTLDDIKWLVLMGPAAFSKRIVLPDQGKFNAAEKLNFMMVMAFPPLFVATGILIWFPDLSRLGAFAPWLVHCGLVALSIPLVFGHMFMATINPSTRVGLPGMINGFVSREWASHHYARWFREQFPHLVQEHAVAEQAHPRPAVHGSPAARPQHGGIAHPAESEPDGVEGGRYAAGVMTGTATGSQEQAFAVDETEDAAFQVGLDERVAVDAAYEVTSPGAMMVGR